MKSTNKLLDEFEAAVRDLQKLGSDINNNYAKTKTKLRFRIFELEDENKRLKQALP